MATTGATLWSITEQCADLKILPRLATGLAVLWRNWKPPYGILRQHLYGRRKDHLRFWPRAAEWLLGETQCGPDSGHWAVQMPALAWLILTYGGCLRLLMEQNYGFPGCQNASVAPLIGATKWLILRGPLHGSSIITVCCPPRSLRRPQCAL